MACGSKLPSISPRLSAISQFPRGLLAPCGEEPSVQLFHSLNISGKLLFSLPCLGGLLSNLWHGYDRTEVSANSGECPISPGRSQTNKTLTWLRDKQGWTYSASCCLLL